MRIFFGNTTKFINSSDLCMRIVKICMYSHLIDRLWILSACIQYVFNTSDNITNNLTRGIAWHKDINLCTQLVSTYLNLNVHFLLLDFFSKIPELIKCFERFVYCENFPYLKDKNWSSCLLGSSNFCSLHLRSVLIYDDSNF